MSPRASVLAIIAHSACLTLAQGCATAPAGHANFTVASLHNYNAADGVELVRHVERTMCSHNVLFFFWWGDLPDHEFLVKSLLEETGGDAITNADLSFRALPLILYNQNCATVSGDVVRFAAVAKP